MEPRWPSLFLCAVESLLFCCINTFTDPGPNNARPPSGTQPAQTLTYRTIWSAQRPRQQTAAAQPDTNTTTSGFHLVSSSVTIWDRIDLHKQTNRLCSCCRCLPPTALSSDQRKTSAITDRSCRAATREGSESKPASCGYCWGRRSNIQQGGSLWQAEIKLSAGCWWRHFEFRKQEGTNSYSAEKKSEQTFMFNITNLELQKRVNALISITWAPLFKWTCIITLYIH